MKLYSVNLQMPYRSQSIPKNFYMKSFGGCSKTSFESFEKNVSDEVNFGSRSSTEKKQLRQAIENVQKINPVSFEELKSPEDKMNYLTELCWFYKESYRAETPNHEAYAPVDPELPPADVMKTSILAVAKHYAPQNSAYRLQVACAVAEDVLEGAVYEPWSKSQIAVVLKYRPDLKNEPKNARKFYEIFGQDIEHFYLHQSEYKKSVQDSKKAFQGLKTLKEVKLK